MKKFYEAPVVELTGFSAEDVITTSIVPQINAANYGDFSTAAKAAYGDNAAMIDFGANSIEGSYNW